MTTEDSQPKSDAKTIRDFVKSGAIVVVVLFIGILLEGLLHFQTIGGYVAADAIYGFGFLDSLLLLFLEIIIYVSFMSFIGYISSISNHKFGKPALGVLHKLLIVIICLYALIILFLPAAQ